MKSDNTPKNEDKPEKPTEHSENTSDNEVKVNIESQAQNQNGNSPDLKSESLKEETPHSESNQTLVTDADQLKKKEEELQALNDKHLRLFAEFENYKRRVTKERIELIKYAGQEILSSLIPVLDDFERAQKSFASSSDPNALKEGVELIYSKFLSALEQKGLKGLSSIGVAFNPEIHQAISNIPVEDKEKEGKVIDEMEKAYFLNEKVIRFGKVVVGSFQEKVK